MKKLTFAFLVLTLAFASCQTKYPDLEDGLYAEIITNKGTFVAKLYNDKTPLTVANFVSLAEGTNEMVDSIYKGKKFYNGLTFHRVMKDFMIQGGCPLANGSGDPGYKFPDETMPELTHSGKGVLSMANGGPATNGSQFFVTLKDTPWLNGVHTVFGEIVLGQDIVDLIGAVPVAKGNNKPVEDVVMQEVNIIRKGSVKIASFTKEMEKLEQAKIDLANERAEKAAEKSKVFMADAKKAKGLESGLKVLFTKKGEGKKPNIGSKVRVNYSGYLETGELVDTSILEKAQAASNVNDKKLAANQYIPMVTDYGPEARLINGFKEGLMQMNVGDKATFFIPSHLGYGAGGYPPIIPANADLVFELEIIEIVE